MKFILWYYLPLEVWTDINKCTWIDRKGMAKLANHFGDRRFVEILMFYLHDQGSVTLGQHFVSKNIEVCL